MRSTRSLETAKRLSNSTTRNGCSAIGSVQASGARLLKLFRAYFHDKPVPRYQIQAGMWQRGETHELHITGVSFEGRAIRNCGINGVSGPTHHGGERGGREPL